MSKLEVDAIEPQSGTTLTIGASGDSVTLGSGASVSGLTLSDNILFNAASKGIYLGVTTATASNLLDDYEEGTWTPVLRDGSNTGTIIGQYGTTVASYTKMGRFVNLQFTIRRNDGAALTSTLFITGLPFTSSSSGMDANINGGLWIDNSSGDKLAFINMGGNISHMTFRNANSPDSSINSDDLVNNRYLYGSVNYIST